MPEPSPTEPAPVAPPAKRPRSIWRRLAVGLIIAAVLIAVGSAIAVWRVGAKVQDTPDFYRTAAQVEPEQVDAEAEAVVESVETILRAEPPQAGSRQPAAEPDASPSSPRPEVQTLQFTEAQLNALLARSEPRLPPDVSAPRLRLLDDRAVIGARVRRSGREAVVAVDVTPTGLRETQVDLVVNRTTAGTMAVPVARVLQLLGPSVLPPEVPITLDEEAGTLALHLDWKAERPDIRLKAIRLSDGRLEVDVQVDGQVDGQVDAEASPTPEPAAANRD